MKSGHQTWSWYAISIKQGPIGDKQKYLNQNEIG